MAVVDVYAFTYMISPFSLWCLPASLFSSLKGIIYFCTTSQFPVDNILDVYDSHDYEPHAGLGRSRQMSTRTRSMTVLR